MLFCGIDIETTGVTPESEITELSWVFMEDPLFKTPPVIRQNFCKTKFPVPENITTLTGISDKTLETWGQSLQNALFFLEQELGIYKPDFIVAHNGTSFDRPMLERWATNEKIPARRLLETPWLDTAADIPEGRFPTGKLSYMAAECGFLNPFPHSAVLDILTMFRVLSHCDIPLVIARSKEPWVTVQALVSFKTKELAKKRRFRWQDCGDGKVHSEKWVKRVKACDVENEKELAEFQVVIIG